MNRIKLQWQIKWNLKVSNYFQRIKILTVDSLMDRQEVDAAVRWQHEDQSDVLRTFLQHHWCSWWSTSAADSCLRHQQHAIWGSCHSWWDSRLNISDGGSSVGSWWERPASRSEQLPLQSAPISTQKLRLLFRFTVTSCSSWQETLTTVRRWSEAVCGSFCRP